MPQTQARDALAERLAGADRPAADAASPAGELPAGASRVVSRLLAHPLLQGALPALCGASVAGLLWVTMEVTRLQSAAAFTESGLRQLTEETRHSVVPERLARLEQLCESLRSDMQEIKTILRDRRP